MEEILFQTYSLSLYSGPLKYQTFFLHCSRVCVIIIIIIVLLQIFFFKCHGNLFPSRVSYSTIPNLQKKTQLDYQFYWLLWCVSAISFITPTAILQQQNRLKVSSREKMRTSHKRHLSQKCFCTISYYICRSFPYFFPAKINCHGHL